MILNLLQIKFNVSIYFMFQKKKRSVHLWLHRAKRVIVNWEKYFSIFEWNFATYIFSRIRSCIRSFEKLDIEKLLCCSLNVPTEFSVTHRTTTNLKFWSRKTDRFYQSHLKSFLDRERKTPLEKTIVIQPDDCADVRQCPEIYEPRFSIKLYRRVYC